ncbi:MAG: signal peptidase II [Acidimicrobiales bacterium]|nr:signal peptidase II [Acidimicrobiales bacterium]
MSTHDPATADAAPDRPHAGRRGALAAMAATGAVVLVLDQLTKWWAVEELTGRTIDVVWKLRFNLVRNPGVSFSLGEGLGPIVAVVAVLVVGWLTWMARRQHSWAAIVALGCVAGGALGNVVDRVFRSDDGFLGGEVIDFIDFQFYPVFNVADMGVVLGVIALILLSLTGRLVEPGADTADATTNEAEAAADTRDDQPVES